MQVPVTCDVAFAVSQTTGELRLRWDPFIRSQRLLGAARPDVGVRTHTRSRLGPAMVSEYVSFRPPTSVGMTMVEGPWFFDRFGGGWRFTPEEVDGAPGTLAVWKYTFGTRPGWLSPSPTGSATGCCSVRSTRGSQGSPGPARTPRSSRPRAEPVAPPQESSSRTAFSAASCRRAGLRNARCGIATTVPDS